MARQRALGRAVAVLLALLTLLSLATGGTRPSIAYGEEPTPTPTSSPTNSNPGGSGGGGGG